MDNDIFLDCSQCRRAFYIQDLTDGEGDIPNPAFCPFCGETSGLSELDDVDEAVNDALRPRLQLLKGGLPPNAEKAPDHF